MALVSFEGKDYQFDIEELTLNQARYISRNCKLSVRKLMDGLVDLDPEALAALYWLMCDQNGERKEISKVDFPLIKFAAAIGDAFPADEVEGEDEVNPTSDKSGPTAKN